MIDIKIFVNFQEYSDSWVGQNFTKLKVQNLTTTYIYELNKLSIDGTVIFSINNDYIEKITSKDLYITVEAETKELEDLIWNTISYVKQKSFFL